MRGRRSTPGELSRSASTRSQSTAAEGALLAGDVADDRTKATFARVHARDLSDVVDHEAEKLNDADAHQANVAAAKTKAIDLADEIDTRARPDPDRRPTSATGARRPPRQLDAARRARPATSAEGL